MLRIIIALALVSLPLLSAASQTIDITVRRVPSRAALLSSLSGEKSLRIDSVYGDPGGRFVYQTGDRLPRPGLYRMTFDRNRWVDFIADGEDVRMSTDASNIVDSMTVGSSEGNRLYYDFVRLNREYKTKSEILHLVLARYPAGDVYYEATRARLGQLQAEYRKFVDVTSQAKPESFAARYVRSAQLPVVEGALSLEQQIEFLKSHGLDHVDFTDEGLVYSDLFTSKSIEYLTYYRNPQFPKELLEKEFMKAVDSLLGRARVNVPVYQHVTEYLLEGFRNFGFEKCIDYILENYVIKDDLCLDESSGSTVQRMVEQKKLLAPGSVVPAIVMPDTSGTVVDVSRLGSGLKFIVFYSSGCPHCRTVLPELRDLYTARAGNTIEVVGVSLDSDRGEWTGFIRENDLSWISLSDLRGWGGETARKYFIYATPTMVVIDGEGRVVGVPGTVEEARKYF